MACPSMHHVSGRSIITARTATVAPKADPPYNYAIARASVFDIVDVWAGTHSPRATHRLTGSPMDLNNLPRSARPNGTERQPCLHCASKGV